VQHYTGKNLNHTLLFVLFIYEDYENTYENLLKKSKLPSLKIRRLRTIAVETFKIIHRQSPSYLHDLISIKDQKYNLCIKQQQKIIK
jgi:hypothetical protein